ncbi:class I SAM-dependent methyltransferase [Streptomyces sp. BE20]|uniref:class I SAM-dependent methyltransferase n=1 Tax=Streptomyces sp. BE20 TaxID=3002525 RepID=UPI002E77B664|nr:class I SAM-dependent methyltransferase [Streptomyces sp. BE20]MEE1823351.1 class I SAM-dependent methyltransferase [Streptomyces sp. BE20]
MNRDIRTVEDVLTLLDRLFLPEADRWTDDASGWWDDFYADRSSGRPFIVPKPDEDLVSCLDRGLLAPGGRALDLGCGAGRNTIHLASQGFEVDAVDLSATAVVWARERADEAGAAVRFHCGNVLGPELPLTRFDLVDDSGCLHHLPPHRRVSYLALLDRVLARPYGRRVRTIPRGRPRAGRRVQAGCAGGACDARRRRTPCRAERIRPTLNPVGERGSGCPPTKRLGTRPSSAVSPSSTGPSARTACRPPSSPPTGICARR